MFDTPPVGPGWSAFTSLLHTWGRVVTIDDSGFEAAAKEAIERHPRAASDAYEVVAEGLLNAVKHSPAAPIRVVARPVYRCGLVAAGGGDQPRCTIRQYDTSTGLGRSPRGGMVAPGADGRRTRSDDSAAGQPHPGCRIGRTFRRTPEGPGRTFLACLQLLSPTSSRWPPA